ncbi:hypothetical protein LNKW23_13290 [Paralimibaculum aggregatum]|uniref:Uncharacterized protein n=1 Tax=Paralimibaculum aggregatum TaxID=3036245 RepID=A0ABQ6LNW8_9RHOB|nr:hypothetical protein LNKW23_13290 [Limibaculum sp. NKW23]
MGGDKRTGRIGALDPAAAAMLWNAMRNTLAEIVLRPVARDGERLALSTMHRGFRGSGSAGREGRFMPPSRRLPTSTRARRGARRSRGWAPGCAPPQARPAPRWRACTDGRRAVSV